MKVLLAVLKDVDVNDQSKYQLGCVPWAVALLEFYEGHQLMLL